MSQLEPRPCGRAESKARYQKRHPEKVKAWWTAKHALRRGTIPPRPDACSRCGLIPPLQANGKSSIEMHHHKGYDHPLDIVWVCRKCHCAEHKGTKRISLYPRGVVLKTHCINGHEFTEANTYWASSKAKPWHRKKRSCRACANDREKARQAKLRRLSSDSGTEDTK